MRALVLDGDRFVDRLAGLDCELVVGDITRPESLAGICDGVSTIYHLAAVVLADDPRVFEAVNVEGTRNMLQAAERSSVGHFILVSSASVVYPRTTPYSRSKRQCEQLVRRQRGLAFTIVRPTLVYESAGGQEFEIFVSFLRRLPVVPLFGDGRAVKNPVHVDDLIAGLAAIGGKAVTHGKIYELCGGEALTIRELARELLAHHGLRKPLVPVPEAVCRVATRAYGRLAGREPFAEHVAAGLTQDANLDRSAAARDLGYCPVGFREALRTRLGSPPA